MNNSLAISNKRISKKKNNTIKIKLKKIGGNKVRLTPMEVKKCDPSLKVNQDHLNT